MAHKKEIWKDVVGYENLYQVSTWGRIKALLRTVLHPHSGVKTYPEKIMTPKTAGHRGYHKITLSKDGKAKKHSISRLVAEAFIPNPENKRIVNHIDGNKSNNHIENLEWATDSENIKHAYDNGLAIAKKGAESACSKRVFQFSLTGEFIASYPSTPDAAKATGVERSHIAMCAAPSNKRVRTAGGFIWSYSNKMTIEEAVFRNANQCNAVKRIDPETGSVLAIYKSQAEGARALGLKSYTHIGHVITGKLKTFGGFFWQRATELEYLEYTKKLKGERLWQ